ncbi:SLC19 family protein [Actinoplanes sp. NBC_00393]|uniref:hypothetical protein n=1 Tax=Actinoplanes sp. NBC_00393 TaxID=2975953 RepID=UPI002E22E01A
MTVAAYTFLGAIVAMAIGYLVNQLPPLKKKSRKTHWGIIAVLAVLGISSGLVVFMTSKAEKADDPIAAIIVPAGGDKISRILGVDIDVTRRPPEDHSLWLGYQNEAGGPLIIQAQECAIFQKDADCGPLHVGRDEKDRSAFKLFLFDADEEATAFLEGIGGGMAGGPGSNMAIDAWPDGTEIISMVRNITLR